MTKFLLAMGALMLVCSCAPKTDHQAAIISGSIRNHNDSVLTIVGNDYYRDTLRVDASGRFRDTLQLMPGSYLFSYGKLFWRTYLENGYDLRITFDTGQFGKSLTYEGTGSKENAYVYNRIRAQRSSMERVQKAMTRLSDSVPGLIEAQQEKELRFLDGYGGLSSAFRTLERRNIGYGYLLDLKRLEKLDTLHKLGGLREKIRNLEDTLTFDRAMDYLFSPGYRRMLEEHYRRNAEQAVRQSGLDGDIAYLKEISGITNDTIRNSLAYNHARYGIAYTGDLQTFYSLFLKTSTDPAYNKEITDSYTVLDKVAKGSPSPGFRDYENYKGGTTSLSDLAGSYLLIDVWATWCGPCRKEIPYLQELETRYHGKNIRFVSISIDKHKDRDKWKKMIRDKKLGGIQLLADKDWESSFVKEYLIREVPRFIILDPEGHIVDYNAPVPSSGKLQDIFDGLDI
ncbi:TlpA family protein disulfide reductase [Sinomicrobium soli]|uniref:TlpA family protein disulfide reductase n=1 Tax=Sinomicrobium sp. N-1-3-6 TaxID=2219864 RepID=UPI000DCB3CF1|nr:TlpA family protein disulfide reductase [Sinomicrobium sp. N-1-3-6]RAV27931.1 hypothetical protein DN748_16150 [Sinomicrobium sp. N-1-3-6]